MAKKVKLDRYDLNILSALREDGRISKVKLAEAVGLSDTPCSQRQKKLEDNGVIKSYHADIDHSRLVDICSFITEFAFVDYHLKQEKEFVETIAAMPEVTEIKAVLGEIDLIVTFATRSVEHYQSLIENLQAHGFKFEFTTHTVSKTLKREFDTSLLEFVDALKD
jgi:Lrp/AsnC family transcriptional regulator, regulator of ectoine-degradation genes